MKNVKSFSEFINEGINEGNSDIKFKGKLVDYGSIEIDDVDPNDYPDFSDAYISAAKYTNGKDLTDTELEQFQDDNYDLVNDLAHEYYR
jgi:hypothetical protein